MIKQVEIEPEGRRSIPHIFLLTFSLLLPGSLWVVFGWASCLIPLIVFIFINKYGWRHANHHFMIAILAAIIIGYMIQSLELTLFTVTFIPAGYVIALSAYRKEQPWQAGGKGVVALGASFFIFFSILLINSDFTFIEALTESLNKGIDGALDQYSKSESISAENYVILEQTLLQVKLIAPMVFPAILGTILLLVSWMTLVLGNTLLPKFGLQQPWVKYQLWKLPDKLIWITIVSGILALIPGNSSQIIGINCLILVALLYGFQGLAILVFMLKKWNIPSFLRVTIYILMLLQSFGTIILIVTGIADVWYDIRRLNPKKINENNDFDRH